MIFLAGACFALGRFTGRPVAVYLLPAALLVALAAALALVARSRTRTAARTASDFAQPASTRHLGQTADHLKPAQYVSGRAR